MQQIKDNELQTTDNKQLKVEIFHREKDYKVILDENKSQFMVSVTMKDAFHDMGVEVLFSYPDLIILSVKPWMTQTPYPICPIALAQASGCVGLQVKPGIAFLLDRKISGREGCSHITNLVLDACHVSIQGLLAKKHREMGNSQQPYPTEDKIAFLEQHQFSIRNTCVAYSVPSAEC